VIVGAGAAGLSFAYYLAHLDSTHEFSCTLIDPDAKTDYDRTWSYWGDHFDFDDLVEREWKRLLVRDGDTTAQACFGGRGYRFVPSDRFYRRCLEVITADSRFSFVRARAERLVSDEDAVRVGVRPVGSRVSERRSEGGRSLLVSG
jgi:flavin-dependent dehydrogenase